MMSYLLLNSAFYTSYVLQLLSTENNSYDPSIILILVTTGGVTILGLITGIFSISVTYVKNRARLGMYQNTPNKTLHAAKYISSTLEQEKRIAAQLSKETQSKEHLIYEYQQKLRLDPLISQLKIFTLSWPPTLTEAYIRLTLHQRVQSVLAKPVYESRNDPHYQLRASQRQIAHFSGQTIEPDQAILLYRHCVFVGETGTGKTTLLQYLALKSANKQLNSLSNLPILVDLALFIRSGEKNLLDFIAQQWYIRYDLPRELARASIEENFSTGNVLLLLDALEDTLIGTTLEESHNSYQDVRSTIMQLASIYPQAFIVVTAHDSKYQQMPPLIGFTQLHIQSFHLEDRTKFLRNWSTYRPLHPTSSTDMTTFLASAQNISWIQSFTSNPLLLALLTIVYEQRQQIPTSNRELYSRCLDVLLLKNDHQMARTQEQQLLEYIAWNFHSRKQRYFSEYDLLASIASVIDESQDSREVLYELGDETGFLRAYSPGWYGFLHPSLQKYFAECQTEKHGLGIQLAYTVDWRNDSLRLHSDETFPDDEFLQKLLEDSEEASDLTEKLFHATLLYAGHYVASHYPGEKLWNITVNRLFDLLYQAPYSLTQQQVAELLVKLCDHEINQRLLKIFQKNEANYKIQIHIIQALAFSDDPTIVEMLCDLLPDTTLDKELRVQMASTLGLLSSQTINSKVVQQCSNYSIESDIRIALIRALGRSRNVTIADDFLTLLTLTSDPQEVPTEVRCYIADALGDLGDYSVVPELLRLYTDQQHDFSLYCHIIGALAMLGEPQVVSSLLPVLTNLDYTLEKRQQVVVVLGVLRLRSFVPDLLPLLADETLPWEIRVGIATAIGASGERAAIPQLLEYLSNIQLHEYVRISISSILGLLEKKSLIPALRKIHADPQRYPALYRSLAITLGNCGEDSVISDLLSWLSDEKLGIAERLNIVEALRGVTKPSIIPHLLPMLSNYTIDSAIRCGIIEILVQLASDTAMLQTIAGWFQALLPNSDISDPLHRALWIVYQRLGTQLVHN